MITVRLGAALLLAMSLGACGGSGRDLVIPNPGEPAFTPASFDSNSDAITNPHCPVLVGRVLSYEARDTDEVVVVEATGAIRSIAGVRCTELREQCFEEGELVEETHTWLAQDTAGNVWVLGESQTELSGGVIISTAGSWDADMDGVDPAIQMKSEHVTGDTYRRTAAPDEVPDWIRIIGAEVELRLPGSGVLYEGCVSLQEWDPSEFGADEVKHYAPGIGLVLEHALDGSERLELVEVVSR